MSGAKVLSVSSDSSTNSSLLLTPPAKGVGYQLSVFWEGTLPELVAQLTQSGVTVFSVTQGEPEERVKTNARDAEILAKYTADPKKHSSVKLGIEYGISRERVCQILRRSNALSYERERRELAQRDLVEENAKVKKENEEAAQAVLDRTVAIIQAEGLSIRKALRKQGLPLHSNLSNLVAKQLKKLRYKHGHSRWQDFTVRKARVEALLKEGFNINQIVRKMRSSGEDPRINAQWVYNQIAILEHKPKKEP